jgi:hypothetical protein
MLSMVLAKLSATLRPPWFQANLPAYFRASQSSFSPSDSRTVSASALISGSRDSMDSSQSPGGLTSFSVSTNVVTRLSSFESSSLRALDFISRPTFLLSIPSRCLANFCVDAVKIGSDSLIGCPSASTVPWDLTHPRVLVA